MIVLHKSLTERWSNKVQICVTSFMNDPTLSTCNNFVDVIDEKIEELVSILLHEIVKLN